MRSSTRARSVTSRNQLPSSLFASLFTFCRACGQLSEGETCAGCGTTLAAPRALRDVGALGAMITYRRLLRSHRFVVIGGTRTTYRAVSDDGSIEEIPVDKVTNYQQQLAGTTWTQAGALLAASRGSNLTQTMRATLKSEALQCAADITAQRGLLVDALRLHVDDLAGELDLSDTEIGWTWAVSRVWRGLYTEATERLLQLPTRRYVGRLALWFKAATEGVVDGDVSQAVVDEAEELGTVSATAAVACCLLKSKLGAGPQPSRVVKLVNAAKTQDQDAAVWARSVGDAPWLESASPRALLLQAHQGRSEPLGEDPSVLDVAPPEVLDDLIDQGAIPRAWLDEVGGLKFGAYVLARLGPERVSDEDLVSLGHDEERVRRAVLRGQPCPPDVSEEARGLYEVWSALRRADPADPALPDALEELGDFRGDHLRAVLDDPTLLPSDELLADAFGAKLLARISEVEPSHVARQDLTENQKEFIGYVCAWRSKEALQSWQWSTALERAKQALGFSRSEKLRDEALNLLACAHWQLGRDESALKALETALEGAYTESLQANIAVVAAELEPEKAASHLSRLVVEAPDLRLRVAAARRAVEIWGYCDEPWAATDQLPSSLAEALRSLIDEPMSIEEFGDILRLLAEYDSEWLAAPGRLNSSPHRDSVEARVWTARARGLGEFVTALSRALKGTAPPQWAAEHRDRLVALALDALVVEEPPMGAVAFGMAVLDEDLPMPEDQKAVLRAFAARGAALAIDPTEGEPAGKFLEWLEAAAQELGRMPAELRDRADTAIKIGFRSLAGAYLQSRQQMCHQAAELHDEIVDRIARVPPWAVNRQAVREAAASILSLCEDTRRIMRRIRRHVDGEVAEYIDEFVDAVRNLERSTRQLT